MQYEKQEQDGYINNMNKHYLKYFISLLLFGSNGIIASLIQLNSYEIVLLRTFLGSLFLISIFLIMKNKFTFHHHLKEFKYLAVSGIAMGAGWIFLYEAYHLIGVSIATLAYYCGPVIVMVLSPILFKEKLTRIKVSGFLIVLVGICLINSHALTETANHLGILYGMLSAVMYSIMVIFNKKVTTIKGLENSILQLLMSCITVFVFMLFKNGMHIQIPTGSILPIMILGIVNTGIGCYLYFSSIGRLPVQTVAVCGYLEPLSAVFMSMIFLKEHMNPLQILGAACIIGGAVFSEGIFMKHISHKDSGKMNYLT